MVADLWGAKCEAITYVAEQELPSGLRRARHRHVEGAVRAFAAGDHQRARELSAAAKVERKVAEKLHAEAARQILAAQNANRCFSETVDCGY